MRTLSVDEAFAELKPYMDGGGFVFYWADDLGESDPEYCVAVDPSSAEAHAVQLCCDVSPRRWDAFWRLVNYCSRRAEIEHGRMFE